jgi:hypothetical protein
MKYTMMKQISIIICLFAILSYSCEHSNVPSDTNELGNFEYTACDTNGAVVVHGSLYLIEKDSTISGSWKFDNGSEGQLIGTRSNNDIELNLTPGIIDASVMLHGTFNGEIYSGKWYYISFSRVFNEGIFVAIKLKIAA